jgi:hypothetical protein
MVKKNELFQNILKSFEDIFSGKIEDALDQTNANCILHQHKMQNLMNMGLSTKEVEEMLKENGE